ncbi:MAG: IclR family transcriptional regulator [Pseudomonadota bacterium]
MDNMPHLQMNRKIPSESGDKYRLSSLERVFDVLECFSDDNRNLSLAELTKLTGLNHTSLKRIVFTLTRRNYLRQDETTRKYQLGMKLLEFGGLVYKSISLRSATDALLSSLSEETGLTVLLGNILDGFLTYLDNKEGKNPVRITSSIGIRRPPHFGMLGQTLLAFSPPSEVKRLLEIHPLQPYTSQTIINPELFRERLETIRANGYVIEFEEAWIGVMGIAAPIWKAGKKLAGAIGIATLISNIHNEQDFLLNRLLLTAAEISVSLGGISNPEDYFMTTASAAIDPPMHLSPEKAV